MLYYMQKYLLTSQSISLIRIDKSQCSVTLELLCSAVSTPRHHYWQCSLLLYHLQFTFFIKFFIQVFLLRPYNFACTSIFSISPILESIISNKTTHLSLCSCFQHIQFTDAAKWVIFKDCPSKIKIQKGYFQGKL